MEYPTEADEATKGEGILPDPPQPAKCRKVDQDGFVTPEPPDGPFHNASAGHSSFTNDKEEDTEGNSAEDTEDTVIGKQNNITKPKNDSEGQSSELRENSVVSMQELLAEIEQEAKRFHMNWAGMFRESETFEYFCVEQLDKMLDEAKALEESLYQQKEKLRQRLHVLSETLRLM